MDLTLGLNEEQKKAVETTSGPVLIIAGAGAGKTKTLTTRIAYLVEQKIASPENILAITFTNKAAKEMKERTHVLLQNTLSVGSSSPLITTFHSLGVRILKEQYIYHNRGKNFSIIDSDDSTSLIKEAVKESGLDPKQHDPKKFKAIISGYKGRGISFPSFYEYIETSYDELTKDVWEKYEKKLLKEKAFDFDDLLLLTRSILKEHKEVQHYYHQKFEYIHIDEYQDTNTVQYEIVKLLTNDNKNICAVGDTDQNIYSWRGAEIKNMLRFEKDFNGCAMIFLEQNYRSTDIILRAANSVIEKNEMRIPKNLFTTKVDGEKITIAELYSEKEEALFVAESIVELWDTKVPLHEIVVLYRANFQSRAFEDALIGMGIPYTMTGTKFYERKEIKDVISYIKAALNRESWIEIKRCINTPARGIGKTTVLKLIENKEIDLPLKTKQTVESFFTILDTIKTLSETLSVSELVKQVLHLSGIYDSYNDKTEDSETRKENLEELVTLTTKYDSYENGLEQFLEDVALQSDQDNLLSEKNPNGIKLMTVHAAKGLEFSYVFIVGLEQGLFPHERSQKLKKEDTEEERRLFYVALTRAREKLFLTYATTRTIFGMRNVQTPSLFLYDIPNELIQKGERHNKNTGEVIVYID